MTRGLNPTRPARLRALPSKSWPEFARLVPAIHVLIPGPLRAGKAERLSGLYARRHDHDRDQHNGQDW
jgi:hypothetical protein